MVKQAPVRIRSKGHEHVYVAVRLKVIPKDRAKKGEFCNLPPLAKCVNLLAINGEPNTHTIALLVGCIPFSSRYGRERGQELPNLTEHGLGQH
jgi:hypothetical protein